MVGSSSVSEIGAKPAEKVQSNSILKVNKKTISCKLLLFMEEKLIQ